MIADVDRHDLLLADQQFQRDAIRQVDRYGMQPAQFPGPRLQPWRWMVRVGDQQQECLAVLLAQLRVIARSCPSVSVVV
ncbi:MAG: hypothetical protein LH470_05410 [Lysobacter sp.]|nr:hypothetical protein [Lysobacter sp.]